MMSYAGAFVAPLFQYRDLIRTLVFRELTVRYRRSMIGFLWTMLQPLLHMMVLHLVFSAIFFRGGSIKNYPIYVLSGIMFWNFFRQGIVASMNSLRGNAVLMQKIPVPKEVFPLATVLAGVVNLLLALVPLFLLLVVTGHPIRPALLFLPGPILVAAVFTLGAGLLLSPLAVFFSDVVEIIDVGLILVFYLTPIFYPMDIIPESFRWVVRFNPVRSILEVFRDPIFYGKIPPWTHLTVAIGISLTLFVVGVWAFRRSGDRIPYYF